MISQILNSGLSQSLVFTLLAFAAIILFFILKVGADSDVVSRTYEDIDMYIPGFLGTAALPHFWMACYMIFHGFAVLYILNMASIAFLWFISKKGVLGGADAISLMLVAVLLPCVFPLFFCCVCTAGVVKWMQKRHPEMTASWAEKKVPLLLPMKWGYLFSLPLSVLFMIAVIF